MGRMPEREAPRLTGLKQALRWLKAQYRRRTEEAASSQTGRLSALEVKSERRRALNASLPQRPDAMICGPRTNQFLNARPGGASHRVPDRWCCDPLNPV